MLLTIRSFVILIVVAALLALCATGVFGVTATREHAEAVAFFALLAFVASRLPHSVTGSTTGNLANLPFIAAIVVAPGWLTCVTMALVTTALELFSKRNKLQRTFNVAQFLLASSLAVLVYRFLDGTPFSADTRSPIFAYVAAVGVFLVTNTSAVAGAVAISEGRPFLAVWRRNESTNVANDLLALPIPYVFALIYTDFGTAWAAGLMIPLIGVRQVFVTQMELARTSEELLQIMVKAIEARDPYTSGHSVRVAMYSRAIAQSLKLGAKQIERVEKAALLHDVGKIHEVFAPILLKPDRLTSEEWEVMKTHPIKSAELVQTVTQLKDLVGAIRAHHESWDGTGYPDQLRAENIPLAARIITFADTIDAMTTDRPYRAAKTADEVEAEILRLRGVQYDPTICDVVVEQHLVHTLVGGARPRLKTPALPWLRLSRDKAAS